jgi:antitoxin HicB
MPKSVEEYLSLPYTIVLRRDTVDNIFVARAEELPGCSAHGETEPEAISNLHDNMRVWIEDCIDSGDAVPEPSDEVELPSGKWVQRVPRSLHFKLIRLAKAEGVSLNQFVTSALSERVGAKLALCPTRTVRIDYQGVEYASQPMRYGAFISKPYYICNKIGVGDQLSAASEIFMEHFKNELPTMPLITCRSLLNPGTQWETKLDVREKSPGIATHG